MKRTHFSRIHIVATLLALAIGGCGGGDEMSASDAGPSAEIADGATTRDGAVVQCQADHQESLEARNDRIINDSNQVEPTGQTLSSQGGFSVCGQLDPAQETGEYADVDVYEFTVSGEQSVRIEIELMASEATGDIDFILLGAEGPNTVVHARITGGIGIAHRIVPAGVYWIAILAKSPLVGAALPYRIAVSPESVDCQPNGDSQGDYEEALDNADHRGNDTLQIDYEVSSVFSETPIDTDAPEPTEITLLAADRIVISGVAANVAALDDYRDRDAFLIRTSSETRELSVRLSWLHTAGVDLDMHVFEAGIPEQDWSFAGAATVGTGKDELATMAVLPGRDYWIWIGAYANAEPELPRPYKLTLCGKSL